MKQLSQYEPKGRRFQLCRKKRCKNKF